MTVESKAEFARRIARNRSHVTRLAQAGRLVLTEDGQVEVEASLQRIEATRGHRFDVQARYADAGRSQEALNAPDADAPETGSDLPDLDEIGKRTRLAQMRREEATARIKEREDAEQAGLVVQRQAFEKAATDALSVLVNAGDTLPDRVAPLLQGADSERIRAILRDAMEDLFRTASEQMEHMAREAHP